MIGINERYFVFYWRAEPTDQFQVSQPITIGELIEGQVELEFPDGDTLPLNDVDWGNDDIKMDFIPQRKNKDE